jgi:hypothetical protein
MNYLIGATAMLFFFIALGGSGYIGYRLGKKSKPTIKPLTADEKLEIERKEKAFKAILNYDINTAMGKKVSK